MGTAMTIRELLVQHLRGKGLFEMQATEVVTLHIDEDEKLPVGKSAMHGRWDDTLDGYPPQLMPVLFVGVDKTAAEWLDANLPNAWFRPLFPVLHLRERKEDQAPKDN